MRVIDSIFLLFCSVKETTVSITTEPVAQTVAPVTPTTPPVATVSTPVATVVAPVAASTTPSVAAAVPAESFSQSSYLKQEPVYAQQQAPQQHQQQQAVPPQQQQQAIPPQQQQAIPQQHQQHIPQHSIPQQQQQQFGMDHLTSAYSSYLPNQPPTGVSGFGMNPMGGTLPDYGIYGSEAQRAAAMVSFFLRKKYVCFNQYILGLL